jgi:peptidoglycan/LPS O-acetylase OafA/YrhL
MALAWRRLGNRVLLALVLAAGVLLAVETYAYGNADAGWMWATQGYGYARVGFSFFAGVLLYRCRGRVPALISPGVALAAAAALLCLTPPAPWRWLYDLACIFIAFPLIVRAAAAEEPRRTAKAAAWLGLISYPLYALHQPLQRLVGDLFAALGAPVSRAAPFGGLALLALFVGCAWWTAVRYDQPVRGWLTRQVAGGAAGAARRNGRTTYSTIDAGSSASGRPV